MRLASQFNQSHKNKSRYFQVFFLFLRISKFVEIIVYMVRIFFVILVVSTSVYAFCQNPLTKNKAYFIEYETLSHGAVEANDNPVLVIADTDNSTSIITTVNDYLSKSKFPFEAKYVNNAEPELWNVFFKNRENAWYAVDTSAFKNYTFELLADTKTIVGHQCKLAKTIVNSNTIEIWYTNELNAKGSPYFLGQNLGLVLEIVRNGNYTIRAKKVEKKKVNFPDYLKQTEFKEVDKLSLNDQIWKSKFVIIPIFNKQLIHFSEEFTPSQDVLRFANGTVVVKKIQFPKMSDTDRVFVELVEKSNGDAYDRTGSVFLIPTDSKQSYFDGLQNGIKSLPVYTNGNGKEYQGIVATENYNPPIELMRFFTPFGVHHFNDRVTLKGKVWQDSVMYRQDISDFENLLNGREVYIGVFIGNYDKGGHEISMSITLHKDDESKPNPMKIIPLFNSVNLMEMAGQEYATLFDSEEGLLVTFEIEEELKNARLRYTTTGHGGWENGDEFLKKKNTIFLNDQVIFDLIPWREDCGSYRLYNPVSGNFSNGLSSSDYSRSNWCPGTLTNPYIIELGDLKPGKHKVQVKIPQGEPEGSSFSAWNVSGVVVGE